MKRFEVLRACEREVLSVFKTGLPTLERWNRAKHDHDALPFLKGEIDRIEFPEVDFSGPPSLKPCRISPLIKSKPETLLI